GILDQSTVSKLGLAGVGMAASGIEYPVMIAADAGVSELGVEPLRRRVGGNGLQRREARAMVRNPHVERPDDAAPGTRGSPVGARRDAFGNRYPVRDDA